MMLDLTRRGAVTVLRMAHGKANALDLEFCEALTAQLIQGYVARTFKKPSA